MKKRLSYIIFLLLITPLCFEGALRIMGDSAFRNEYYSIKSSPINCLIASANMGFALSDGSFEVTINKGHTYMATHKNGERRTSKKTTNDSLPQLFLMGCSYTYGMGVDDDENFPFLVQQELASYRVRNFGVPGFGTVQSYLQLKKEFEGGSIPKVVIINYCDFHAERNALLPSYRSNLSIGYQNSSEQAKKKMNSANIPYLKGGEIKYEKWEDLYRNWTGRETFAMINYLQRNFDRATTDKINVDKINLDIFLKIQVLCENENVRLIVTQLIRNKASKYFLEILKLHDFEILNISLNLTTKKYTNLPYDSHPNNKAHVHYAQKISQLF